jgi:uncharacterized membrane protein
MADDTSDPPAEPTLFSAIITPHRSLSSTGFVIFMLCIGGISFAAGMVREWTLNPVWVRLDRIVHEEFGIERLFLVSHGRRLSIANFLGPDEKKSFATALSAALGEARRGPTRTII